MLEDVVDNWPVAGHNVPTCSVADLVEVSELLPIVLIVLTVLDASVGGDPVEKKLFFKYSS